MHTLNSIDQEAKLPTSILQYYKSSLWVKLCVWIFGGALILGLASQAYLIANQSSDAPPATTASQSKLSFESRSLENKSIEPLNGATSKSFDLPGSVNSGAPISIEEWSPALVKLGFSFFVGLSIGYVVKAFFKISLFFSGIIFLLLFGLSYFNIVEVKWDIIESLYDSIVSSLDSELAAFKDFITGSLPSAGSFGFGLLTSFRRR